MRPADLLSPGTGAGDVILGIDIGTTSVKVAAFTPTGTVLGQHRVGSTISRPRPGWAEQDPVDWWNHCIRGIAAVVAGLPAEHAVRSIGIVSQVNTHVVVDENLQPLAPAIIWQDQRCSAIAAGLDARFTPEEKVRLWGAPITLDASFTAARALWFAREAPREWARTRWIVSPKDFVAARLTGQVRTDGRAAVRLADRTGTRYLPEAVGLVDGLEQRLPPIADPTAPLGEVTDPGPGVGPAVVVVGTSDTFGDVYGTGTTRPGRAMITVGTSLVAAGASTRAVPTRGIATFPPRGGIFVHAGPTQAAGDALRWWSEACGLPVDAVAAQAAAASAGSSGVVFTPHLMGERAPLWDAEVRGSFLGLSSATTREEMSRAVLEGVAMSARQVLTGVEEACDMPLEQVVLAGGGARSDLWVQIHADVLGRPVRRLRVHDTAVLGAALLGAVGAGIHPDIETAADAVAGTDRVVEPVPASSQRLGPLYEVYTASHRALAEIHAALGAWRAAG
ncbi:xylulokinase [Pseudonocardia xinjiangensis]|uniref:xylulokinase n=1 Tax=Pseudonocardia xinjiangensis TaxID=75289 RepID=UPI003D89C7C5